MQPEVTKTVGGFTFSFKDEKIKIKVSRLKSHSDGRLNGELLITSLSDKTIYPQTSFNFLTDRSRSILASNLTKRDKEERPWADILNQLSLMVVNRVREGDPVQELWTNTEIRRPEYLLYPILYRNLPTVMFGEKGVCKSTIALTFYSILTTPILNNELGFNPLSSKSIRTLYCDWEVEDSVAQFNLQRIQRGMGWPDISIFYRRCLLPLAEDVEQIQGKMSEVGAEALIIDSLGPAVGGDLKSPESALHFTKAIRSLNCSPLVIGQTSKDKDSKTKSVYGSTFFEYYARNIIELKKIGGDEDDFDVALINTYNNLGKKFKPIGLHISFTDDTIALSTKEASNMPELYNLLPLKRRIADFLLDAGMQTLQEIAKGVDASAEQCRVRLYELRREDKVLYLEKKWGMKGHSPNGS